MRRRQFLRRASGLLIPAAFPAIIRSAAAQSVLTGNSAWSGNNVFGGGAAPVGGGGGRTLLNVGLVSYYRFEEAAGGNNAVDASGNGRDLTQGNNPGSSSGIINNCRTLSAGSSYRFARADESALRFVGDFTVTCWAQISTTANKRYLINKDSEFLLLYDNSSGFINFTIEDQTTTTFGVNASTFGTPPTGTWFFIAVRRFGNTMGISINGGTENTASCAAGTMGGTGTTYYGVDSGLNFYWDGKIDESGRWSRALTLTDIGLLYNSGAGRDPVSNP
jgi:hypothetical protein